MALKALLKQETKSAVLQIREVASVVIVSKPCLFTNLENLPKKNEGHEGQHEVGLTNIAFHTSSFVKRDPGLRS